MRYLSFFLAVLSVLTGAIGAFAQGTNGQNAITYPLGGTLDGNVPLTITWTPSTQGTITINLLKGPPSNLVDLGPIAASINNDGTFTWTIPNSLQDSGAMPKGDRYGFKIIDDATKTFEYSPPFDLSIPGSTFGGATASGSLSATASPTTSIASVSSAPSSLSATLTPTPTSATTQESITSTSDFFASTTQPPESTSTDLPSDILPNSVDTSPQSTLVTTTASATPTPSQSNIADTLTPNSGPNVTMIIGLSAGAFGGLALLIVAIVVFVKCRKRRSRARARAPLATVQPPVQSMRGYGDGMYNRV